MVIADLKSKLDDNTLDLSLNELEDVPVKELAAIPKATHIDLSCNKIRVLPSQFTTLTHIVKLELSKNQLTELPKNFGNLSRLQYLDLYGNQLTTLPVSFARLKNLKWLDLKNNPLNPSLKAVAGDCLDKKQCEQCAKRVVEYMQTVESNLEREKQRKLKEEREKEALKKAQEERELQRQKEEKKAARQKKKSEQRQLQERIKQERARQALLDETHTEKNIESSSNGNIQQSKKSSKPSGATFVCHAFLSLVIISCVVVTSILGYHIYNGQKIESVNDAQKVLMESWQTAEKEARVYWTQIQPHVLVAWKHFCELAKSASSFLSTNAMKGYERFTAWLNSVTGTNI